MAPIKFEENIREKLEKRTLEPSSQAWGKLSQKLEEDTRNSSFKIIWCLGVAASIIGILFMVNVFYKTTETNNNIPVMVDTETKKLEVIQNKDAMNLNETLFAVEDSEIEDKITSEELKKVAKVITTTTPSKYYSVKNTPTVEVESHQKEEAIDALLIEIPSTEMVLAQTNIQLNNRETNTDIDALLKQAQQKLARNSSVQDHAIDAQVLLQDVEEDIETSFRDKVFETLITGYKKVRTAVAERNN